MHNGNIRGHNLKHNIPVLSVQICSEAGREEKKRKREREYLLALALRDSLEPFTCVDLVQFGHLVAAKEYKKYPLSAQKGYPLWSRYIPDGAPLPLLDGRGMVKVCLEGGVLQQRLQVNRTDLLPMNRAIATEYKCQGEQQYHGHYHWTLCGRGTIYIRDIYIYS